MPPMKSPAKENKSPFAGTVSLEYLAKCWPLSVKQIRQLLANQELAFIQIKGSLRVPKKDAEQYEREHGLLNK